MNRHALIENAPAFRQHLIRTLGRRWCAADTAKLSRPANKRRDSAVLLLLEERIDTGGHSCLGLVLNKRSNQVRQPGDICCPGGGFTPLLDTLLASLLRLPGSPLMAWRRRHNRAPGAAALRGLSLVLAAGLRESFEEMGLNPLRAKLLGPLPTQHLQMFRRRIHPLAVWIRSPRRFRLNWEVEKLIRVPLTDLLDPKRYARYCLNLGATHPDHSGWRDFPCFRIDATDQNDGKQELLWGATYRIVMSFLYLAFGFTPPALATLPAIVGQLPPHYAGVTAA